MSSRRFFAATLFAAAALSQACTSGPDQDESDESVTSPLAAPSDELLAMEKKTKCESNDGNLYCVVKDGKLTGAARLCDGSQQVGSCPDGCTVGAAVKNKYGALDLDATCPNKKRSIDPTTEADTAL